MSDLNDGGPAFPGTEENYRFEGNAGMSLRDYFAAKTLAAMISNTSRSVDLGVSYPQTNLNFALASYAVADAMLAAREQR